MRALMSTQSTAQITTSQPERINPMPTLKYSIYNEHGERIAATRHAEDAAMMVSACPDGGSVRYKRRTVWREGVDGHAGESYDDAAIKMFERINRNRFS